MFHSLYKIAALAAVLLPRVSAVGPTDSYSDADTAQSGYLSNHNMDPAVVDSSAFGQLWKVPFNAQEKFYAKPLVYTPNAGNKQLLFLASSQNWIRTLDAKTGAPINARQVHTPFLQSDIGCTDIPNTIGIIGTPVIDPATDIAYFFAKTYIPNYRTAGATGTFNGVYYFHGVNVNTLADVFAPILVDGSQSDNAPAKYFLGGTVLQRPSLTQIGSVVYGAFGGHCDLFNYTGAVLGVDVNLQKVVTNFAVESGPLVPQSNVWDQGGGGGQGGIWMSGMPLSTDGQRLFFVSGNGIGHENAGSPASGSSGCRTLGEACVNLGVGGGGVLSLTDYFQPYDYNNLDAGDQDFGSGGVALLDPTTFHGTGVAKMAVTAGKNGKIYILNANNLGGYRLGSGQSDGIIQTIVTNKAVFGGVGSYPLEGGFIYATPVGYPTYVFKLGFSGSGTPIFSQVGQTTETSAGRVGAGSPTVTSLQGRIGTGILWMCDPDAGLRAWYAVPGPDGTLKTIKLPQVNGLNKFQRPAFGDSRLYVTDANGVLYCLGSPVNLPLNCSSPVNFGQVALGSKAVQTVSCKANIAITQITGVTVGDAHFEVSSAALPSGPIAAGTTFSFPVTWNLQNTTTGKTANASYGNTQPGVKSTALTLSTINSIGGYSTQFPISLIGTEVSQKAFLVIAPITVDYGGIVLLNNQSAPAVSLPFVVSNAGLSPLTITGYAYTTDDLSDPDKVYTNVTFPGGSEALGNGFTSDNLPAVGTQIAGGSQISVDSTFSPINGVASYKAFFTTWTTGGSVSIILEGSASTAPVATLSISNGEGGWLPNSNLIMDFGDVAPSSSSSKQIRICNAGGSVLEVSKSKPPNGVFRPEDPTALHESQNIAVGTCAYATVLFITNSEPPNLPDQIYTNTWTLNTNDLQFGVHTVQITGTVVDKIIGPTNSNGSAVYNYLGCYHEIASTGRLLPNLAYDDNNNTNGRCQTSCQAGNYIFAGTEYARQCFCGNAPPSSQYLGSDILCNYACNGDPSQECGGSQVGAGGYVSIYYDPTRYTPGANSTSGGTSPTGGPLTVQQVGNYNHIGCYAEATTGRALSGKAVAAPGTGGTVDSCQSACQGYTYFGVEYANECFCGNTINAASVVQTSTDPQTNGCSMVCGGNSTEYCGGPNRLDMYAINGTLPVPTTSPTASTPTPTPSGGPSTVQSAGPWAYYGCYTEATNGRALSGLQNPVSGAALTVEGCASACTGWSYFGVEYGGECYCGNTFNTGSVLATGGTDPTQNGCSMTCNGNVKEYCGGPNRLNTYSFRSNSTTLTSGSSSATGNATGTATPTSISTASASPTPTGPITVQVLTGYNYLGCYSEATNGRSLSGLQNPIASNLVSVESCSAACSKWTYFGVEYSGECFCGNTINAGSVLVGGTTPKVTQCNMICNGNATEFCGGPNRLNMYEVTSGGISSTSTNSITPTGNATMTATSTPSTPTPTDPAVVQTVGNYSFQGCYSEATTGRALTGAFLGSAQMTIEMCAKNCAAYVWFGVEYGQECYCGKSPAAGSVIVPNQSDCNFPCPGNGSEYCGAGNRLNMYNITATASPVLNQTSPNSSQTSSSTLTLASQTSATTNNTIITSASSTSSSLTSSSDSISTTSTSSVSSTSASSTGTSTSSVSSTSASSTGTFTSASTSSANSTSAGPTTSASPSSTLPTSTTSTTSSTTFVPTPGQTINAWAYLGCANETNPRALAGASFSNATGMTVEACQTFCSSNTNNYGLAGVEYGRECYCGNGLQNYASVGQTGCNVACSGNKTELCGGSSRLSLYNLTTFVPPTTVKQVGTYVSQGCYNEIPNGRLLSGPSYVNSTGMTVEACVNYCQASGNDYAGVEYAQECFCGSSLPSAATTADVKKCNMLCTGNKNEFCGAGSLANVYHNVPNSVNSAGTPASMNNNNAAVVAANNTTPTSSSAVSGATAKRSAKFREVKVES